jgi:NIPSNAP
MNRRRFLGSALAGVGATTAITRDAVSASAVGEGRLFYLWRHYELAPGVGGQACDEYFRDALIPAANRLGVRPIGAFNSWFAPTDALGKYLLLPSESVEVLATLDARLAEDAVYAAAAQQFLAAPVAQPPFVRMASSLMHAMPRFPKLTIPERLAMKPGRIFEFRIYEQPTEKAHAAKMDMFQNGEDDFLRKVGFSAIFYAKNVIGERLPSLSYMWIYDSLEQRQRAEEAWVASEDRAALFANPRFAGSNSIFGNIILRPTAYSQI